MGFFDILPGAARRAQRLGFCSSLTYFQVLNRGNKTASTEGSGWEARGNQRLSEVRSGMKLKKCKPLTLLGAQASYNPWLCSPELPSLLVTEPSCPAPELGYLWCWQWRSCGWCCTGPSRPKQSPGLATVKPCDILSSASLGKMGAMILLITRVEVVAAESIWYAARCQISFVFTICALCRNF
jgi:hypothetical protein